MRQGPLEERAALLATLQRRRRMRTVVLLGLLLASAVGVAVRLLVWDDPFGRDGGPYRDVAHRFTVTLPPHWAVSERNLEPSLGSPPWEIFAAATYPMRPGGKCPQFPTNAIEDLPPTGALVVIQEPRDGRHLSPRPARTFLERARPDRGKDDSPRCLSAPKSFTHYFIDFQDGARAFYAYIAVGRDGDPQRLAQAISLLDSFRPD